MIDKIRLKCSSLRNHTGDEQSFEEGKVMLLRSARSTTVMIKPMEPAVNPVGAPLGLAW